MYSYSSDIGELNNVVRTGKGFGFSYETVDTAKRSGMVYDFVISTVSGYYKSLPGNKVLQVEDTHASVSAIFPFFILFRGRLTHRLGFGLGMSTLLYRDYYDQNGTVLTSTTSAYQDVSSFKYWRPKILLDYELALRSSKRMGFLIGSRYNFVGPYDKPVNGYLVTPGEGLTIRIGAYYRFGMKF